MSSSRPIRVHVDVENPPTNEDSESAVLDDTYSINSDAARRTPTPMPSVEDSYSIIHSIAISTVPPAAAPETTATASIWSRFFGPLCCCYRRRKKDQPAEDQSATSCQNEINLHECVEKLEVKVKSCQVIRNSTQHKATLKLITCFSSSAFLM